MQIVHTISDLREALARRSPPSFVPTMGNLHDGHIALIRRAAMRNGPTVASIFVNRLQFLPHEDFDQYPRTLAADASRLEAAGCSVLFAPSEAEMYREPQTYRITPDPALADILEGEFRPGFFTGVCTVVMKLFQCVRPHTAIFGKKDFQQLAIIRGMVEQLAIPVRIVACDTQRDRDGLALSSRNAYLSRAERAEAPRLHAVLAKVAKDARAGASLLEAQSAALDHLVQHGWRPDYVEVRTREGLRVPNGNEEQLVVLGAARLGATRLLDNVEF